MSSESSDLLLEGDLELLNDTCGYIKFYCSSCIEIIVHNFPIEPPEYDEIEDIYNDYVYMLNSVWKKLTIISEASEKITYMKNIFNNKKLHSEIIDTQDNVIDCANMLVFLKNYVDFLLHMLMSRKLLTELQYDNIWRKNNFVDPIKCLYVSKLVNLIYSNYNIAADIEKTIRRLSIPYEWRINENVLENIFCLRENMCLINEQYKTYLDNNIGINIPYSDYWEYEKMDNKHATDVKDNIIKFYYDVLNTIYRNY